jgi:hypothetical protein
MESPISVQFGYFIKVGYLRQVWDTNYWLYEEQREYGPGYSGESQVITVCQDIVDFLDKRVGIDVIVIDFSKAFDLVPHDQLLMELAASGVESRVVNWVREFLVGPTQRVRVVGQLCKEVKVTSSVLQGSISGLLLFPVYVSHIWKNSDSSIRLFADNCIIHRKITNKKWKSFRRIWTPWASGW